MWSQRDNNDPHNVMNQDFSFLLFSSDFFPNASYKNSVAPTAECSWLSNGQILSFRFRLEHVWVGNGCLKLLSVFSELLFWIITLAHLEQSFASISLPPSVPIRTTLQDLHGHRSNHSQQFLSQAHLPTLLHPLSGSCQESFWRQAAAADNACAMQFFSPFFQFVQLACHFCLYLSRVGWMSRLDETL